MELTKSESNLLEILLEADKPLSKSEILDHASADKPWKDGSIHILLNSLLKKEVIYEAGFVRTGKGFGRTFAPTSKGRCKCQYKNAQKVENKNVHFPKAIPQPVFP